jgi:hypothetical protein
MLRCLAANTHCIGVVVEPILNFLQGSLALPAWDAGGSRRTRWFGRATCARRRRRSPTSSQGKQNEAFALIGEANAARAQGRPDLAGALRKQAQAIVDDEGNYKPSRIARLTTTPDKQEYANINMRLLRWDKVSDGKSERPALVLKLPSWASAQRRPAPCRARAPPAINSLAACLADHAAAADVLG